ncbi:MAG: DUF2628 domain-containing protein [Desulfamplus sp.]|nr:DUF2628 domain-containing protein [Desulfamplus sp.]
MSYCIKCGKEVLEGSSFCKHCGGDLSAIPNIMQTSSMSSGLTNEDFITFVGTNFEKYLRKFAKFNVEGIDTFKATWHWPAFFVPFWWLLYRKMYGWAILVFVTSWIPYIYAFNQIVLAITANYIYYKHAKKKILEIKQQHPEPETQKAVIAVTGGVKNAVFIVIAIIAVVGILAAIAIPNFISYRNRAYKATVKSELTNLKVVEESYFAKYNRYSNNLRELNFAPSTPNIIVEIISADEECFKARGTHARLHEYISIDCNGLEQNSNRN